MAVTCSGPTVTRYVKKRSSRVLARKDRTPTDSLRLPRLSRRRRRGLEGTDGMRGLPRLVSSAFARRAAIGTYTGAAIALGYALRGADEEQKQRQLPLGWRACCEARALTPAQQALPDKLSAIVGASNVERAVEQRGSRLGLGEAFVVVKPGTLQEAVDALQACVDADACVIPQGANTGLTGGSVPRGAEKGVDRPTVVINMLRMNHIMPIDDGARMVCLAGAGIHSVLQKAASMNKESHSVLGSIFLNPTTAAGIAFGSGGTQVCGAFGSKHMRNVKSHPSHVHVHVSSHPRVPSILPSAENARS